MSSVEPRAGLMQQTRDRLRTFVESGTAFQAALDRDIRKCEQRGMHPLAADLTALRYELRKAVSDARRVLEDG